MNTKPGLNQTLDLISEILNFDIVQLWNINYNEINNNNSGVNGICQYSYLSLIGKEICPEKLIKQKDLIWMENIHKVILFLVFLLFLLFSFFNLIFIYLFIYFS